MAKHDILKKDIGYPKTFGIGRNQYKPEVFK